jgi:hypothetical protein
MNNNNKRNKNFNHPIKIKDYPINNNVNNISNNNYINHNNNYNKYNSNLNNNIYNNYNIDDDELVNNDNRNENIYYINDDFSSNNNNYNNNDYYNNDDNNYYNNDDNFYDRNINVNEYDVSYGLNNNIALNENNIIINSKNLNNVNRNLNDSTNNREINNYNIDVSYNSSRRNELNNSIQSSLISIRDSIYVSKPGEKDKLEEIPEININSTTELKKLKTKNCTICLEDYKVNDKLIFLPCFHLFHKDCIVNWAKRDSTCPLCKTNINDNIK